MRFGITEIDKAPEAAKMGFDYLEVNASALEQLSGEAFERELVRIRECGLPAECSNILFHDITLLTDEGSGRVEEYLRGVFCRLQRIGVETAVFGSGAARRRPEGMPYAEAWRRLRDVLRLTGSLAGEYGIRIAFESLCRAESDMVNTIPEAAAIASAVDLPNVWIVADSYHIFKDGEPVENLRLVGRPGHVHVALRDGRCYPTYPEGQLRLFMDTLHAIGYDGRVTIEASTRCFEAEAPLALATLRCL